MCVFLCLFLCVSFARFVLLYVNVCCVLCLWFIVYLGRVVWCCCLCYPRVCVRVSFNVFECGVCGLLLDDVGSVVLLCIVCACGWLISCVCVLFVFYCVTVRDLTLFCVVFVRV